MDELGAVWLSPQNSEDELKHKILLTTFELETLKMEVNMIRQQREATEKQLQDQLELAYKERDEAKLQLKTLLESFMLASSTTPQTMKDMDSVNTSPTAIPVKPHSAVVTDQSNDVDSFFDTVSSASKSVEESQNRQALDDELNSSLLTPSSTMLGTGQPGQPMIDRASAAIEQLVNGKMLPQKGRLLEAVMEAGPTLQAMMVAGPLPQWKNPPPAKPFRFSPVLPTNNVMKMINNHVAGAPNQTVLLHPRLNAFKHSESKHHRSPFCGSLRMDDSMADLTEGSACCLNNKEGMMNNVGNTNSLVAMGKRRRILL